MFREQIGDGYRGTAATIEKMHLLTRLAVEGVGPSGTDDDRVLRLAREIVQPVAAKDYRGEVAAIFLWCQTNLRYVRDPWTPGGVERLQHPAVTLFESRGGDCDELAPAFSALCASIGAPWAFETVGVDPLQPNEFLHVYSLVHVDGEWVAADISFANVPLGWEPPADDPRFQPGVARTGVVKVYARDWPP